MADAAKYRIELIAPATFGDDGAARTKIGAHAQRLHARFRCNSDPMHDHAEPHFELIRKPSPDATSSLHPVAKHFVHTLHTLTESAAPVRMPDGRTRPMNRLRVHELLTQRLPGAAVSQAQVYRYFTGESLPNTAVIWELAGIFGVSPRLFMPADTR